MKSLTNIKIWQYLMSCGILNFSLWTSSRRAAKWQISMNLFNMLETLSQDCKYFKTAIMLCTAHGTDISHALVFSSPVSCWGRFENGNWTAWSAIWSEIICMISKLKKCAAQVWFEITSMISDKNCTMESLFTTLVHPFWKYKIKLLKYRIFLVCTNDLLIQYRAGL